MIAHWQEGLLACIHTEEEVLSPSLLCACDVCKFSCLLATWINVFIAYSSKFILHSLGFDSFDSFTHLPFNAEFCAGLFCFWHFHGFIRYDYKAKIIRYESEATWWHWSWFFFWLVGIPFFLVLLCCWSYHTFPWISSYIIVPFRFIQSSSHINPIYIICIKYQLGFNRFWFQRNAATLSTSDFMLLCVASFNNSCMYHTHLWEWCNHWWQCLGFS